MHDIEVTSNGASESVPDPSDHMLLGKTDVSVEHKRCHVTGFQLVDADVIPVSGLQPPLNFS